MILARRTGLCLLVLLAATGGARAAEGPVPPCAGEPLPGWPAVGAPPKVAVWQADDHRGWDAPACSGLTIGAGATLITVAGSFRARGGLDPVLGRIGAISRQLDIRLWDADRQAWQRMLEDAAALAGPDADLRRTDFEAADFRPDARLHVLYDDAEPLGPVIYETRVLRAGGDGLDLATRNVVPARLMGFTVAGIGDIASHVALRRARDDVVRYWAVTAVTLAPMAAAMTPESAHVSRAVATFRYVAGIPTDAGPPAEAG